MKYRPYFADLDAAPLTLAGFKDVEEDPGFDVWTDTSTSCTRILSGHVDAEGEAGAEVVASGILDFPLMDFIEQLTTFRVDDNRARALNVGGLFGKLGDLHEGHAVAAAGAG